MSESAGTAVTILSLLIFGGFAATWKHGRELTALLLGASACLMVVQVNGVHIYTFLLVFYVLICRTRRRFVLVPVLLFLASLLFASTVFFGPLVQSSGPALQLAIMSASAVLLVYFSRDVDLEYAKIGLLVAATLGAAIGVLQVVGIVPVMLFQLPDAEMHRPSSIYPEPDWFGLFSAVGVCLAFAVRLRPALRFSVMALCGLAVLVASARAAWLALVVVAFWSFVRRAVAGERSIGSQWKTVLAVLLVGGVMAVTLFSAEIERGIARVTSALDGGPGDSAVRSRMGQVDGLLTLLDSAPLYGQGISAGGRVGGVGIIDYYDAYGNTYSSNWLLAFLVEGMLLALPLIGVLVLIALFGNRANTGQQLVLLVLVNSLFSNAFYFPIFWFALALAMIPSDHGEGPAYIRRGAHARSTPLVRQGYGQTRSRAAGPRTVVETML